jgi:hypothetical protein
MSRGISRLRAVYAGLHGGGGKLDGCIATFRYADDDLRTLFAYSRREAFLLARRRWGPEWIGEPCFSTPMSIYLDLIGETKRRHGAKLRARSKTPYEERRSRRWREGRDE